MNNDNNSNIAQSVREGLALNAGIAERFSRSTPIFPSTSARVAPLDSTSERVILFRFTHKFGQSLRMDWKLLGTAFTTVFLAELGDKTQLATLSLSAGNASKWTVFAGSASALVATSLIAVVMGGVIGQYVSPVWIKRGAGTLFIVLGVLYWLGSLRANA